MIDQPRPRGDFLPWLGDVRAYAHWLGCWECDGILYIMELTNIGDRQIRANIDFDAPSYEIISFWLGDLMCAWGCAWASQAVTLRSLRIERETDESYRYMLS